MNRLFSEASDNSRINETAQDFNARAPLLGNGTASNKRRQRHVTFKTPDDQASLNKNEFSKEQGSLGGSCAASSEKTPPSGEEPQLAQATPLPKYEDLVIDDELYALGGAVGGVEIDDSICRSTEVAAIGSSTAEIEDVCGSTAEREDVMCGSTAEAAAAASDAIGDSTAETVDASKRAAEVIRSDTKSMVESLFYTWMHFPPKLSMETRELELFTQVALKALASTWRHFRTVTDVRPEPKEIVQGLTEHIVRFYFLRNRELPAGKPGDARRRLIASTLTEVEEAWTKVLDEVQKQDEERVRKRKEKRQKDRERLRRAEEVAEVLRFYAPYARINPNPPKDCRRFGLLVCGYFSLFIFQIPLQTLMLGWPMSMGVMGGLYMTQCPMSQLMPYVMMALGVVGTIALLLRLSFVIYQRFTEYPIESLWPWIVLRFIEFIYVDCLIVQMVYFFSDTPNYIPGTSKYCNETFYNFVHWMNYVSIALVSAWIFVYIIKGYLWLRRKHYVEYYRDF